MSTRFFSEPIEPRALFIALVTTLVAAWLLSRLARRLATAGLRAMLRDTVATSSPQVRGPLRIVTLAAFTLALARPTLPCFRDGRTAPTDGGSSPFAVGLVLRPGSQDPAHRAPLVCACSDHRAGRSPFRVRNEPRDRSRRGRARQTCTDARLGRTERDNCARGRHRVVDGAEAARSGYHAGLDRRGGRRTGDRIWRADAGARHHQRLLPDSRGSNPSR